MRLRTWYFDLEASRRIAWAQMAVWFAGASPVVVLAYVFAEIALGHPGERARLTVTPAQLAAVGVWVAAGIVSGRLIGARRTTGIYLGVAMFVVAIAASVTMRRLLGVGTVVALVGLILLARARTAIRSGARASAA